MKTEKQIAVAATAFFYICTVELDEKLLFCKGVCMIVLLHCFYLISAPRKWRDCGREIECLSDRGCLQMSENEEH